MLKVYITKGGGSSRASATNDDSVGMDFFGRDFELISGKYSTQIVMGFPITLHRTARTSRCDDNTIIEKRILARHET